MVSQIKLPSVREVRKILPLSSELKKRKEYFDRQIKLNITAKNRLAAVVGPCSADDVSAVGEFCRKLKNVSDCIGDAVLTAVRVYTSKPHSDGEGYKGLAFYGKEGEIDMAQGILNCRRLMIDCLQTGLPVADELLYPSLYPYFSDLVSWWFVGARSSEDAFHRSFASGLDTAVGIKNAVSGFHLQTAQSVYAATRPQVFPFDGKVIHTLGNAYAHVVLRGRLSESGYVSNITDADIAEADRCLTGYGLKDVFIMADLSHANSGKNASRQSDNARLVLKNRRINGIMAESYLFGGSAVSGYGVSKTDPCLDFDATAQLLRFAASEYRKR